MEVENIAGPPHDDPDDFDHHGIPESLQDAWALIVREWDQWDEVDRLVHTYELAGRLIIEKTRRGQPYILICAPGTSRGDSRVDYRPLDQASHDKLGPHDFYLPTSYLRRQGGNWFARISSGIDAEAERMRSARLEREAWDAAASAEWNAECAKPMRERQYFLFAEIADALALKPGRLEVDMAERDRIVLDLADRTRRGEFDLPGVSEVVTLIGEPPYFVPIVPVRAGEILADPEALILRCDACRRYLRNSPLEGASRLLRDWFPEQASGMQQPRGDAIRPNRDEPNPDDRAALLTTSSGQVMPPDEAEEYTLLWDAAAEMSRSNVQSVERNWLRLMDAVWRGDLAPDGLTYFYPAPPARREFVVYDRAALAGLLLGPRALETGAASIDDLRHWRVSDYRDQPAPFGDYFEHDPEGRVGLAAQTQELDRWRHRETGTATPIDPRSDDKKVYRASQRRGAYSGALDSWMAKQDLTVLLKMEPAGIAREFKSYCDEDLPKLIPLLPKRLRSMESEIDRIIKRRVDAARAKTDGPNPIKARQSPLRARKSH